MNNMKTLTNLVNGLEMYAMRQIFIEKQEDEDTTNEQLVRDSYSWDRYMFAYCAAYQYVNKSIIH
jgi:hypothetical protein